MLEKNNKRTINGWCMYDWANSVYSLVITTAIFPGYFYAVTGSEQEEAVKMKFLGLELMNTSLYTFTLSFAFIIVALINPVLSSLADVGGNKKRFMQFFCFMGAISCSSLFFFTKDTVVFGVFMFALAGIGWAGSLVFYNSFLPEISSEENFDSVSAKGFSLGYVGSVILLIINLVMILNYKDIGFESKGIAVRYSFLIVGIWWFGFSLISFSILPNGIKNGEERTKNIVPHAISEFKRVWFEVKQLPLLGQFLKSFLFYSMGVQTIMYLAALFGKDVVKMKEDQLIILILILQLVAIGGAFIFSKISNKKGNIFAIKTSILSWILICLSAFFMKEGMITEFYILGVFVGLMMGAIQSMSRSTYAKFIPAETKDLTSYFSFYETIEKFSIAIGTMICAILIQQFEQMNVIALALALFFIIGFSLIYKIPSKKIYNTTLKNEA